MRHIGYCEWVYNTFTWNSRRRIESQERATFEVSMAENFKAEKRLLEKTSLTFMRKKKKVLEVLSVLFTCILHL